MTGPMRSTLATLAEVEAEQSRCKRLVRRRDIPYPKPPDKLVLTYPAPEIFSGDQLHTDLGRSRLASILVEYPQRMPCCPHGDDLDAADQLRSLINHQFPT